MIKRQIVHATTRTIGDSSLRDLMLLLLMTLQPASLIGRFTEHIP